MKKYTFQIVIDESDVKGDEFWETALEQDDTGIKPLTEFIIDMVDESNLIINSNKKVSDIVKLVRYVDN